MYDNNVPVSADTVYLAMACRTISCGRFAVLVRGGSGVSLR